MTTEVLIITGGYVLQLGQDPDVIEADIRINGTTGKITDIGTDLVPTERTDNNGNDGEQAVQTLDAAGCVVMPGLVNAHTHAAMTLLRGFADDKPLEAWLREDIWPAEAEITSADVRAGTELAIVEMIQSGTTAFADMYFHVSEVVAAIAGAGLRARVGHGIVTTGKDDEAARNDLNKGLQVARKYDGAADGRVHTAFMPHSLTTVGEEYLQDAVSETRNDDIPVHYHANETRSEVDPIVTNHGQRPLVYAATLGMLSASDFLAHGVHVDTDEISRLAETGASIIHCPASNMKLASGIAPIPALLDAGVTVGLGTDGAASNNDLDMFDELRDAAMLGKIGADDAAAVPAAQAIHMATAGGADALGLPGGRVEEGAAADLIAVDLDSPHLTPTHNIISHLAYAARGSDVKHTICDGTVLMRNREVQTIDVEAVVETAETRAESLIERMN
ncbi:amidohydrolase [Haloquadratum walsbyi]|uniref:5-methylthioadenosine/S-adenosylhomocysteine deaminase n=1 Tax=Haloquadratum walsbyi J07HQW2 TaxID=1238425 RepID=U1NEZ3_9EURY|nr:amidohydrolase [Haloquadratum walsbyi]ERG95630.1 MAG: cytosine deaminase related metal-dependent hydrolase [Haloquadratum walsbyi J07HQW2]